MARSTGGRAPRGDGGVQWFRALVLIAVLVVIGIFILARTTSTPAGKTSTSRSTVAPTTVTTVAPTTTTVAALPASQVKVQVLNGLRAGNLSSQWVAKLKSQYGYQTGPPDDATSTVTTSAIYVITPGYQSAAAQLAARIGLSPTAVNPTVPAPATAPIPATERATANLVLVIGRDLAG